MRNLWPVPPVGLPGLRLPPRASAVKVPLGRGMGFGERAPGGLERPGAAGAPQSARAADGAQHLPAADDVPFLQSALLPVLVLPAPPPAGGVSTGSGGSSLF